jgi:spore germination cell wall hydrolase CwlJ-like protein
VRKRDKLKNKAKDTAESRATWSVICLIVGLLIGMLFSGNSRANVSISPPPYSDMEGKRLSTLNCLIVNNYWESRGESDIANMMVMSVVYNRVLDKRFPDTICGVVFQSKQFSWLSDGKSDKVKDVKQYKRLYKLAEEFLLNRELFVKLSEGITHYHTTAISPYWSRSDKMQYVMTVDNHKFYKWRK